MTRCKRCGAETVRKTRDQRYCDLCQRDVEQILRADAARRDRFAFAKAVTP